MGGDLFANLRVGAGRAAVVGRLLQEPKSWQVPFPSPDPQRRHTEACGNQGSGNTLRPAWEWCARPAPAFEQVQSNPTYLGLSGVFLLAAYPLLPQAGTGLDGTVSLTPRHPAATPSAEAHPQQSHHLAVHRQPCWGPGPHQTDSSPKERAK